MSGFALFTLCHYFGRRGRAMARSLAGQVGCPLPLHLSVFYSREEDARLVEEGAADGPASPELSFIHVPESHALQRARYYSDVHTRHERPFTVFVDSDLWFPPDFWAGYAEALEKEPRGYWSCRVLNIPESGAEECLSNWRAISEERLKSLTAGRRHENFVGMVGHFQCVPRDFARYPSSPRFGVDHSDLEFSRLAIRRSLDQRSERRIGSAVAYHFGHPHAWDGTGGVQL